MLLINELVGVLVNFKEKHRENFKRVTDNVATFSYQLNRSDLKSGWMFRSWGLFCLLVYCHLEDGRQEIEIKINVV